MEHDQESFQRERKPQNCEGAIGMATASDTERDLQRHVQQAVLTFLSQSQTSATGNISDARREITEAAAKGLCVRRVGIWLFDHDDTVLRCIALHDSGDPDQKSGLEIRASEYPAYFNALAENRSLAATDARTDSRTAEFRKSYLEPLGITSMLDAPIRIGGRMVGVICHEHAGGPRDWTFEEQAFAASMADFVALTLLAERRRDAELAIQRQHAFLRQIIDLNPNLIFAKDRQGRFTLVNQATADFYGTTVDNLIGRKDSDISRPEEVASFRRIDCEVIDSAEERFTFEAQVTDPTGHVHWLQIMKRPLTDADGHTTQVLGVGVDITDRKLSQERAAIMLRELDHRVKNNLFSVQALAEQTARSAKSVDDFVRTFNGRIRSMAIAHEALARAHWQGAELADLVRRLVEPYSGGRPNRFELRGSPIVLSPTLAPPICMVLHELAINASKYGALSQPNGRVVIDCSAHDGQLRLTWSEIDGPPVTPPVRRGFGMELVHGVVEFQLRGKATLDFRRSGLVCEIEIPL